MRIETKKLKGYFEIIHQSYLMPTKFLRNRFYLTLVVVFTAVFSHAQDSVRVNVTSSLGVIKPLNGFSNSFGTSFSVNSGLIYKLKKHVYLSGVLSVNMLKYDQTILDEHASYSFQNTSSPFIQVGLYVGRNINFGMKKRFTISPYAGIGGLSLSEPRLSLNEESKSISQTVIRNISFFYAGGTRILFNTRTKLLQTLFIDTKYWRSPLVVQDENPEAISLMIGTKIGF